MSTSDINLEIMLSEGGDQDEFTRMEQWLDDHPQFVHEYFVRKAKRTMVDAWLITHAFSQSPTPDPKDKSESSSSNSKNSSGTNTPVRKISAQEFERSGQILRPIVSTVDGVPTFLSPTASVSDTVTLKPSRKSVHELKALDERELMYELVIDICNDLDVTSLCHKILKNVSLLVKADRCSLFLVQGNKNCANRQLVSQLFDVTSDSSLQECTSKQEEIRIPWGCGIVGHVAKSGKLLNIPNAYEDARFNNEVDTKTGYKTRSILACPIIDMDGEVVGVAQCINKILPQFEPFNGHDEKVFQSYLAFCGIGIRNAQIYERSELENRRNQLLLDLARVIFEEQSNVATLIHKIMMHTQSLLRCERCQVLLIEEHSKRTAYQKNKVNRKYSNSSLGKFTASNSRNSWGVFSQVFDLQASDFDNDDSYQRKGFEVWYGGSDGPSTRSTIVRATKKEGPPAKLRRLDLRSTAEPRFPINIGITGFVAARGETLNIPDAYKDDRFDPAADEGTGFKTQSILCMPIKNAHGQVIGVCQFINKLDGSPFNKNDENLFEAFAIFCGLGINNTRMYEKAVRAMAKQRVALEVLSYHAAAPNEEVQRIKKLPIASAQTFHLFEASFDDFVLEDDDTLRATIRMFLELDLIEKFHINYEVFCRWLLSVKKNYRNVTYHNWRHAFNVAQTMFWMITQGQMHNILGDLECLALLVGCLCHDLDHRGTNNQFQIKTMSPLAQLYSTSVMEHHHFDQCIMILNTKGNEILLNLSQDQYERVIRILENAILATDLALYFRFRGEFFNLVESSRADWSVEDNRDLLRSMMMTACDIAAITKPWETQKKIAEMVANEFFEQGDLEKAELNLKPIDMMDRDKEDQFPRMQVGFIDSICMPVYQSLSKMNERMQPLLEGCTTNRNKWQQMTDDCSKNAADQKDREHTHKDDDDPCTQ